MSTPELTTLLGFRQSQIMRHLWVQGSATVREVHSALTKEAPLTYNTVLTLCHRLRDRGLLERHRVAPDDTPSRAKQAYVYMACVTEAELLRREHAKPPQPPFSHVDAILTSGEQAAMRWL